MKRRWYPSLLVVGMVIFTGMVPDSGRATCDLENASLSLSVSDKPISEILQHIESEVGCRIQIKNKNILQKSISMELHEVPFQQVLKRILKRTNHSIIYSADRSQLTVIIMGKSSVASASSSRAVPKMNMANQGDNFLREQNKQKNEYGFSHFQDDPEEMMGLSAVNEDVDSTHGAHFDSQDDPEEMKGLSAVNKDVDSTHGTQVHFQNEPVEMMGASVASENWDSTKEEQFNLHNEPVEMRGVSADNEDV